MKLNSCSSFYSCYNNNNNNKIVIIIMIIEVINIIFFFLLSFSRLGDRGSTVAKVLCYKS